MGAILEAIENNPKEIKRLLGIDQEQFRQLIAKTELLHKQKQEEIEIKKLRVNKKGGEKKPKLSQKEQILLTLIYLRHSPTFQLLGIQFGVSETTANDIFHYWLPIISEALPPTLIEQVKKCEGDYEWLQELLSELQLIVDTSEQVRERPGGYLEPKQFYSGKKKTHTMKNQFIVLPDGKDIVDILPGVPGPKSDINLLRERFRQFAPKQKFGGDKAYQGEAQVTTPCKKPKGGQLTDEQKQQNREFSQQRIFVEHVIRLIKIFNVARERFRLNCLNYKPVILVICGLVRLRIKALILSC
ncbi:transposase family protein [Lyngbya aestuarii]|uniref:transposase family protein n=1 Tax=Lyngbya aestuarii TaxID=118322 RepID=UPI00403DC840